jgi:hypothetical protein
MSNLILLDRFEVCEISIYVFVNNKKESIMEYESDVYGKK